MAHKEPGPGAPEGGEEANEQPGVPEDVRGKARGADGRRATNPANELLARGRYAGLWSPPDTASLAEHHTYTLGSQSC